MSKKAAQNINTPKSIKLSLEQISEISERQYNQAMKHVSKFNRYQEEKKKKKQDALDSQCTFRPNLLTKNYKPLSNKTGYNTSRNLQRPEKRLNDWGKQKNARQIAKILSYSVQLQNSKKGQFYSSLEKRKSPKGRNFLPKNLFTQTASISSLEPSQIKNSYMKRKHISQSTLFQSDSSKSKSYLLL